MHSAYLSVSMVSARSAAAHLGAKGFDGEAFLKMVQYSLDDLTAQLGFEELKSLGKRGDGRVDGAQAFVPPPAPVADLTAANKVSYSRV